MCTSTAPKTYAILASCSAPSINCMSPCSSDGLHAHLSATGSCTSPHVQIGSGVYFVEQGRVWVLDWRTVLNLRPYSQFVDTCRFIHPHTKMIHVYTCVRFVLMCTYTHDQAPFSICYGWRLYEHHHEPSLCVHELYVHRTSCKWSFKTSSGATCNDVHLDVRVRDSLRLFPLCCTRT